MAFQLKVSTIICVAAAPSLEIFILVVLCSKTSPCCQMRKPLRWLSPLFTSSAASCVSLEGFISLGPQQNEEWLHHPNFCSPKLSTESVNAIFQVNRCTSVADIAQVYHFIHATLRDSVLITWFTEHTVVNLPSHIELDLTMSYSLLFILCYVTNKLRKELQRRTAQLVNTGSLNHSHPICSSLVSLSLFEL